MHPWYYAEAGQQHGPISKEDLQSKLGARTLAPDALVWTEGMPEWKPANSISGLWVAPPQQPPAPPGSRLGLGFLFSLRPASRLDDERRQLERPIGLPS